MWFFWFCFFNHDLHLQKACLSWPKCFKQENYKKYYLPLVESIERQPNVDTEVVKTCDPSSLLVVQYSNFMQTWLLNIWEHSSYFFSYWTYIPDAQDIFGMCPHWCLAPFWPVVTHEFQSDSTAVHSTKSIDNMKIQSVKEKFPVSVFCITVPHTCTWLMRALRWYAICTRYLESLVFTSLCPSLTQIRGKSQKKRFV